MVREMVKASAFADSIYVTTQNTMQRQFGNILHPDPKSMRSALVLWRSALVAITRHARQRSSNATLAASPGGLSGTIRKSGGTDSSGWREQTRHRFPSLRSTFRGF